MGWFGCYLNECENCTYILICLHFDLSLAIHRLCAALLLAWCYPHALKSSSSGKFCPLVWLGSWHHTQKEKKMLHGWFSLRIFIYYLALWERGEWNIDNVDPGLSGISFKPCVLLCYVLFRSLGGLLCWPDAMQNDWMNEWMIIFFYIYVPSLTACFR